MINVASKLSLEASIRILIIAIYVYGADIEGLRRLIDWPSMSAAIIGEITMEKMDIDKRNLETKINDVLRKDFGCDRVCH
jgi:hypothetical protein